MGFNSGFKGLSGGENGHSRIEKDVEGSGHSLLDVTAGGSVANQISNLQLLLYEVRILTNRTSYFFFHGSTALVDQGLLAVVVSGSHSNTPHSVGLLWTSDRPVAETST